MSSATPPPARFGDPALAPTPAYSALDPTAPLVMLIDDSAPVRKIIEVSLARVGIATVAFADGLSAMQALARNDVGVPNLLLLDIGLPKMDGYEVAQILRSNRAFEHTIILMLTGRDGVTNRLRSRMVGARGYITKPFKVSDVVRTVCEHLHIAAPVPAPVTSRLGGM
jgi:twitching motility two-component system response regulator PilG